MHSQRSIYWQRQGCRKIFHSHYGNSLKAIKRFPRQFHKFIMRWNDEHTDNLPTICITNLRWASAQNDRWPTIYLYLLRHSCSPLLWHANSAKFQGFFNTHSATTKVAKLHRDNFIKISSENSLVNRLDEIRHAGLCPILTVMDSPWKIEGTRARGKAGSGGRLRNGHREQSPFELDGVYINLLIGYIWHTSFNHKPLSSLCF